MTRKWVSRLICYYSDQLSPQPEQWPEANTDDYRDFEVIWDEALSDESVGDAQAFAAVRKLCKEVNRPIWRGDHLPGLLEMVRRMKAENVAQGDDGTTTTQTSREAARDASVDCSHCGGIGLTLVYHRDFDGCRTIEVFNRAGDPRTVAATASAWCICPLGQWIRESHKRKDPDTAKRMVDLGDVLPGGAGSTWFTEDPSLPELPWGFVPRIQDWRKIVAAIGDAVRVH